MDPARRKEEGPASFENQHLTIIRMTDISEETFILPASKDPFFVETQMRVTRR